MHLNLRGAHAPAMRSCCHLAMNWCHATIPRRCSSKRMAAWGSASSTPSARNLDTGNSLRFEVLKGGAITRARLDVAKVTPSTEAVVFRFAPVAAGTSVRLRMSAPIPIRCATR